MSKARCWSLSQSYGLAFNAFLGDLHQRGNMHESQQNWNVDISYTLRIATFATCEFTTIDRNNTNFFARGENSYAIHINVRGKKYTLQASYPGGLSDELLPFVFVVEEVARAAVVSPARWVEELDEDPYSAYHNAMSALRFTFRGSENSRGASGSSKVSLFI